MSPAKQSEPRAQGALAQTPFVHLVLYLHREKLSGTLVLSRGEFEVRVLFKQGRVAAARGLPPGLGLQDGLLELCNDAQAGYAFWDDDLLADGGPSIAGSVDPFTFAANSLRGLVREPVIASVVDRYRGTKLRALPEANSGRFGMRGAEARVIEMLRGAPMTIEELADRSPLSSDQIRRIVYLLLITRLAVPDGAGATGTSGVRSAVRPSSAPVGSQPPREANPGESDTRALADRAKPPGRPTSARVDPNAPRSAVEVTPPTPRSGATSSYSSSGSVPSPVPAWQQLATRRAGTGSEPIASKGSTPSFVPVSVDALDDAGKLKRAEQLAARRNYAEVARIVDDVLAKSPNHPEALAMRAWTLFHSDHTETVSRELLDLIARALRFDAGQPQALYVKGLIFRRMGRELDALRLFQQALESNPRHIEAARELRLARMRRDR